MPIDEGPMVIFCWDLKALGYSTSAVAKMILRKKQILVKIVNNVICPKGPKSYSIQAHKEQ